MNSLTDKVALLTIYTTALTVTVYADFKNAARSRGCPAARIAASFPGRTSGRWPSRARRAIASHSKTHMTTARTRSSLVQRPVKIAAKKGFA